MWLPPSIYERVPQIMLMLGLLFMVSAAYIGFDHPLTKLYFGTGVVCFLWSLWVITMRLRHRKPDFQHTRESKSGSAPASDEGRDDSRAETGARSS